VFEPLTTYRKSGRLLILRVMGIFRQLHSGGIWQRRNQIFPSTIYLSIIRVMAKPPLEGDMVQGTLDLLILHILSTGPAHGHTIAYSIEHRSEDVLQVEHGSLYPALHRLEDRGWIAAFWGTSENNRRARYYRLTPKGRKQLLSQTDRWEQLVQAIGRILRPATD
jgi:PadR family transcriptional regulator, regulatory protein PadR